MRYETFWSRPGGFPTDERFFSSDAPSIVADGARFPDDAMAGDEIRDGVSPHGAADGPCRPWRADPPGHGPGGGRLFLKPRTVPVAAQRGDSLVALIGIDERQPADAPPGHGQQ